MTNDGNNTLVYDAENRLLSAANGGGSGSYTYDGNNLRMKKVSGSTTTVYIFSGSKVVAEYSGTSSPYPLAREYIYSGSALLAKVESGATKYYHQDHLSNRVVTDSSGNKIAELGHYPFGESWYNASNDKLQFTSYERDSESGNDYAMARSYVNRLARFSSPDPLAGSINNPQSLNHYSYGLNDPANLIDPTGLFTHPIDAPPDPTSPWGWDFGGGGGSSGFGCFDSGDDFLNENTYFPSFGPSGCLNLGPLLYGRGGGGGGGPKKYTVNLKVLNDCLAPMGIHTTIDSLTPSTPGGFGTAKGKGEDWFSGHGNTVPITVTNDAQTYNAAQVGQMCNLPSAFGCTDPRHPYTNYTNNNNTAFGTVRTQVWELGNSLSDIQAGSPLVPKPSPEAGKTLDDCVRKSNGIQPQ